MRLSRKLHALSNSSDGRGRLATLASILVLASLLVLVLAVLPAVAGDGPATTTHTVYPKEVAYGGGSGACFANIPGRLPTVATNELHINNPKSQTYTGPDGTKVEITVDPNDEYFDFSFVNNPEMAAFDVVVNGGSKSAHFDYDDHPGPGGEDFPGPQRSDTKLHAPTKGGSSNLYQLSHINICYDVKPFADLSVKKTPLAGGVPVPPTADFVADVGEEVTFEIEVTNSAASTVNATNVIVEDTLPPGMDFVSATGGGIEDPTGTVTWTIPSIEPGPTNSVILELVVEITEAAAGTDVTNSVTATGTEPDPNSGDNNENVANSVPAVTVTADVSGIKFHDRDTDGTQDPTEEEGLEGWTVAAFDADAAPEADPAATAMTNEDGLYTIANLEPGTYRICEQTNTAGLPNAGDFAAWVTWAWTQSVPATGADCSGSEGYEPFGYTVTVDSDVSGIDFGNHTQVSVTCSPDQDVIVTLGGTGTLDNPLSSVTFPKGCSSGLDGNPVFTSSFDVGRSNDSDDWAQFVVFGGDPDSDQILDQVIFWDAEVAEYVGGSLVVPTTQVRLTPDGELQPVVFCSSEPGLPNSGTPQCLDYRTIAEGGPPPLLPGEIQLTEYYRLLGDPANFR